MDIYICRWYNNKIYAFVPIILLISSYTLLSFSSLSVNRFNTFMLRYAPLRSPSILHISFAMKWCYSMCFTEYILFACIYPIITISLYSPSLYFYFFKASVRKSSVRMPPFFTIHMNVLSFYYTIEQGEEWKEWSQVKMK